jgi:FdhE protein
MRQGEVASQGKWAGTGLGGVKAPEPVILPDPTKRFAGTARRLEALEVGHPIEELLRFMRKLACAQHIAATTLPPLAGVELCLVEQMTEAGIPPLAAGGYRREPAWRDALFRLLDNLDDDAVPPNGRAVIDHLRNLDPNEIEALADGFLQGSVKASEAGQAIYVAAALQVHFTRMAACLPASALQLLPKRGLCPCCGSPPIGGLVTASGQTSGARYLYCSLCSTAWNHVRATCLTCGGSRAVSLQGVEGDSGLSKAETCGDCRTYAKVFYQTKDMAVDPFADDLATLALDFLVADAGWSRHAPNPLLLISQT